MVFISSSLKIEKENQLKTILRLIANKQTKKAIDILNELLKINPKDIRILGMKGSILCNLKKYNEAIKNFNKVLDINPNYLLAIIEKSDCLIKLNKTKEARSLINNALKKKLIRDKGLLHIAFEIIGISLVKEKKYKEAKKYFKEILEIDKNCITSIGNLGFIFYKEKRYKEAVKYLKSVLKHNPNEIKAMRNLVLIYINKKRYNEAISYLKKIIKIDKQDIISLDYLFECFIEKRDYINANKIIDKILKFKKDSVTFTEKARLLFRFKKYKEAIRYSDYAIKKDKSHICPYSVKINALIAINKKEKVSQVAKKILKFGKFRKRKEREYFLRFVKK